jgi:DNA (cytosine-5)-methyltransferase 1
VVFENVAGLTRKKRRGHLASILLGLMDSGYSIQMKILNASNYGVPQHRQRLFLIASRTGILPLWPDITHPVQKTSVFDAIGDLQFLDSRRGGTISKYKSGAPEPESYAGKMRILADHDKALIFNHNSGRTGEPALNTEHRVLSWNSPARTIMATKGSRNSCLHPGISLISICGQELTTGIGTEQYLTPRESCRLMGISDDVFIYGPLGCQYRQIGNAVCPPLARAIAEQILQCCLTFGSGSLLTPIDRKRGAAMVEGLTDMELPKRQKAEPYAAGESGLGGII